MNELHKPLVEVVAKASADRWGQRNDPPGNIAQEDARVAVYAVLTYLADNPTGSCPDFGEVILADELRQAAKDLHDEGFRSQRANHPYRISWESLKTWARLHRLEVEADRANERKKRAEQAERSAD